MRAAIDDGAFDAFVAAFRADRARGDDADGTLIRARRRRADAVASPPPDAGLRRPRPRRLGRAARRMVE